MSLAALSSLPISWPVLAGRERAVTLTSEDMSDENLVAAARTLQPVLRP